MSYIKGFDPSLFLSQLPQYSKDPPTSTRSGRKQVGSDLDTVHSRNIQTFIRELPTLDDSCEHCRIFLGEQGLDFLASPMASFEQRLARLASLPANWNGMNSEPPNPTATKNAWEILYISYNKFSLSANIKIRASAENGLSVSFTNRGKRAAIECYNKGNILAATYGKQVETEIWDVGQSDIEIEETLERINAFING